MREVQRYESVADVLALMGFEGEMISAIPQWYATLFPASRSRRWGASQRNSGERAQPSGPDASASRSFEPEPPACSKWSMGYVREGATNQLEMKHKGPHLIEVGFNFDTFDGYPTKWHLEGPNNGDAEVPDMELYARRLLHFLLLWVGNARGRRC